MCFFHSWDKWEQYDVKVPERMLSSKWMIAGATNHMQKRVCKKCGQQQIQKVAQTVH